MSSSTQTNPLLLSTENIIAANSIAFTVIYALLFVVLAVRLIRKPVMTFAYVLMTLFAAREFAGPSIDRKKAPSC